MASKAPSGSKSSSSWTKRAPEGPQDSSAQPDPSTGARILSLGSYACPTCLIALSADPLAVPYASACLLTLTLASPSACPVLFCTSLLPGDRPTKNSPCSLSRPQLPKEQEMRGARRLMSRSPPQTPSSEPCPALQPGTSANLAISGASHTPSLGGGLPISAYNHRAVPTL